MHTVKALSQHIIYYLLLGDYFRVYYFIFLITYHYVKITCLRYYKFKFLFQRHFKLFYSLLLVKETSSRPGPFSYIHIAVVG